MVRGPRCRGGRADQPWRRRRQPQARAGSEGGGRASCCTAWRSARCSATSSSSPPDLDYLERFRDVQDALRPGEVPIDAAVVWVHPGAGGGRSGSTYYSGLERLVAETIDAVEVYNGSWLGPRYVEIAERIAAQLGMARTAGSDAHAVEDLMGCYTELPDPVTLHRRRGRRDQAARSTVPHRPEPASASGASASSEEAAHERTLDVRSTTQRVRSWTSPARCAARCAPPGCDDGVVRGLRAAHHGRRDHQRERRPDGARATLRWRWSASCRPTCRSVTSRATPTRT